MTYPTLTQVPPRRLFSTAMVLTPYMPLALLAVARPPLPIPRTRSSHSFGVGAMLAGVAEKCRFIEDALVIAVFTGALAAEAAAAKRKRGEVVGDSLPDCRGIKGRVERLLRGGKARGIYRGQMQYMNGGGGGGGGALYSNAKC